MSNIVIIGPAHPLRGGLATFNQRLAKEFIANGDDCSIYSFSLQYPSFLFPGKTQYTSDAAPEGIKIISAINSINPFNWLQVGTRLRKERPDIIVVRFWLPFMGPALGTILRRVKKNHHTRVVCIADNIIPHEHRLGDRAFTKYFLKSCDAFITMSEKVMSDLREFESNKPARFIQHPLYDTFGEPVSKSEAREKLKINNDELIILFFGFIRKYKGLDILLESMFAQSHCTQSYDRMVVIGYGHRHSVKILMLFLKHFPPIIIKSRFRKFLAAGCSHSVIDVTQKCDHRVFLWGIGIMMNIIFRFSTAPHSSYVQFVAGWHIAFAS